MDFPFCHADAPRALAGKEWALFRALNLLFRPKKHGAKKGEKKLFVSKVTFETFAFSLR